MSLAGPSDDYLQATVTETPDLVVNSKFVPAGLTANPRDTFYYICGAVPQARVLTSERTSLGNESRLNFEL